ncbi:MAG: cysteine desulfurase family protein [Lachnospiraceae bacterium]
MELYFDNAATTKCSKKAAEAVLEALTCVYGNPSAMHAKGVQAEKKVQAARSTLARLLKAEESEIIFTSGGTESDNLALAGVVQAAARTGNHVITTAVEHPAVSEPVRRLRESGCEVTVLPVDGDGAVDLADLKAAMRSTTVLVSVMYVNNEIGTIMPIAEIGAWLKKEYPAVVFHVDAVQAFGKYKIFPKRLGIDLLSVSAHKLHGPKGIGLLYIRKGVKCKPQILGGGQQLGLRSGTDNVPGIMGLAIAAEESYEHMEENAQSMRACKMRLLAGLQEIERVVVHGAPEKTAEHIVSASFLGIGSEVLLHTLEERGIYLSAGSACATHKKNVSPTLSAMQTGREEMESVVRFSFSGQNTPEEVEICLQVLKECVPKLRRYTAR